MLLPPLERTTMRERLGRQGTSVLLKHNQKKGVTSPVAISVTPSARRIGHRVGFGRFTCSGPERVAESCSSVVIGPRYKPS